MNNYLTYLTFSSSPSGHTSASPDGDATRKRSYAAGFTLGTSLPIPPSPHPPGDDRKIGLPDNMPQVK